MLRELRFIEYWRVNKGLSQKDVAHKIGVSPVTYNRWVNEKSDPSSLAERNIRQLWGRIKGGRARKR